MICEQLDPKGNKKPNQKVANNFNWRNPKPQPTGANTHPVGKPAPLAALTGMCRSKANAIQNRPMSTYLMVREVPVWNQRTDGSTMVPVFLDPGSQTSFITAALAEQLRPQKISSGNLKVCGIGGVTGSFPSPVFSVLLCRTDGGLEQVKLNQIERITPPFEYLEEMEPQLTSVAITDNAVVPVKGEPHILLGVRDFWRIFVDQQEIQNGLFRIDTILGTFFGGEAMTNKNKKTKMVASMPILTSGSDETAENLVKRLWSLEAIGVNDSPLETADDQALKLFHESIQIDSEGRYEVQWPWKSQSLRPPDNFSMAFSRLANLAPKLKANPELLQKYQEVLDEQIKRGIIEPAYRVGHGEHFLPHHPVITSKLRIVYDASAHAKGAVSLNDCLLAGPNLVPDLAGMLLRFRAAPVPVLADIEKAFLMIGLSPPDREVAKFLWLKDTRAPLTPQNLAIFRFRRVAFGVISSPFILAATLRHHLANDGSILAEEMSNNLYVDNLLLCCDTAAEATKKAKMAKEVLARAQMRLREFVCLEQNALIEFPDEEKLTGDDQKVLGMKWKLTDDQLSMEMPTQQNEPITRRKVLASLASLFDPLGLCAPLLVKSKLFFQELWDKELTWDDPLSETDGQKWQKIESEWKIDEILIKRHTPLVRADNSQIHIFTDASPEAYCAVAYLRTEMADQTVVSLIFAKSRLRPKKSPVSVPRMELLGVLIGTRIKEFHKTITMWGHTHTRLDRFTNRALLGE